MIDSTPVTDSLLAGVAAGLVVTGMVSALILGIAWFRRFAR